MPDSSAPLTERLPWLADMISRDRADSVFAAWGRSTVVDEHTGTPVISQPLYDALHLAAGVPRTWPEGNAGLIHAYGYLFSEVRTPFGLKRERWIGTALTRALALPDGHFTPEGFAEPGGAPSTGTAAAPESTAQTLLTRVTRAATRLLAHPEYRLRERVDGRETLTAVGRERAGGRALVYAVAPEPGARPKLVTMFPIAGGTPDEFTADWASDRLRWNAV